MKKTLKRLMALVLAVSLFTTSTIYALGDSFNTEGVEVETSSTHQAESSEDSSDAEQPSEPSLPTDGEVSTEVELPTDSLVPEVVVGELEPTVTTNATSANKEAQSKEHAVVFERPIVDGGDATILAFGIDEEYNNDSDYEPVVYGYENTYEEGTVLYYKISTLENFEIKEVTDQDGNTISPSAVKDFISVYTFEVTDDMTITTVYDVVTAPEGSVKVTYQVAGDVYPDEFKVPASQILSEGENSATDLAQVENVTDENNVTWTFDGWYLDETLTEKIDTLTLTEDITVYGAWKAATAPVFTVTTSIDNGGTINVIDTRTGGEVKARTSEAVTVNFEPATGYEVSEIIVNDEALTGDDLAKAIEEGSYTITKLDAPYTINVATRSSNGPYTLTVKLYGMTVEQAKAFDSSVVINDYKKDEFLLASINMGEFNRDASKNLSNLINSNNINFKKITDASNGDIIFQSAGVGGNSKISVDNLAYSRFVHDNYIYQYRSNTETSTSFTNQLKQTLSGDITLELFYSEVVTFNYRIYNKAEGTDEPALINGAFSLDKDFSYLYTRDTNIFNSSFKYIIGEAPSFEGVTFSNWFYGVEGNADQAVNIVANGVEAIAKEHGYTKLNDESDVNGLNRSYIDLYAIYTSDKNISFAYQIGDGEVENFSGENNVSFAFNTDLEKLKDRITNKIDYLKTKVLDDKYDVKSTYVLSSNEDYTKWENLPGKNETIVIKFEQIEYTVTVNVFKADPNNTTDPSDKLAYTEDVTVYKHDGKATFKAADYVGEGKANISGYTFSTREDNKEEVTIALDGDKTIDFYYDPYKVTVNYKTSDDGENWNSISDDNYKSVTTYASFDNGAYSVTPITTAPEGYAYKETIGKISSDGVAMNGNVAIEVRFAKIYNVNVQYIFPTEARTVFANVLDLYSDMSKEETGDSTSVTKAGVYTFPVGKSIAGNEIKQITTPAGYKLVVTENSKDFAIGSGAVMPAKDVTVVLSYTSYDTGTIQIQYVDEAGEVLTISTTKRGFPGVSYQALINDFTPDAAFTSESDVKYYLISDSGKYASGAGSYVAGETHAYTYTYSKFSNVNFDFAIAEVDNTDRPIIDSNLLSSINEIKKDLTEENKKAIEAKVNEINKALVDMGYQFTGIASNSLVSYDENGVLVNNTLASDVNVVLEFERIPYTVNIKTSTEDTYGEYSHSEPVISTIYKNELLTEGFTKTYSNPIDEFDTTVYYYAGYNNQKDSSVINSENVEYTVNKDTFKNDATSIELTFVYNKYRVVKTQVTVDGVLQSDEIINGLVDLKLKSSGLDNDKNTAIKEYVESYLATKADVWPEYDIKNNVSGIEEDGTIPNDLTVEITARSPKQVIIRYATAGNSTLAEIVLTTNAAGEKLYFGDSYDFSSYVLAGGENLRRFSGYNYLNYTGNYTSPEGGITEDVILEVIYSTSGGGGGGGEDVVPTAPTFDPIPTTPTPADPTPAPTDPTPATPDPTPAIPDPTPVVDEPAVVTPDADYNITPVEDTETPLANVNLDGEGFCILHLLIMLAALATLISYTDSMKKRQKRIFELEEEVKLRLLRNNDEEEINSEKI